MSRWMSSVRTLEILKAYVGSVYIYFYSEITYWLAFTKPCYGDEWPPNLWI